MAPILRLEVYVRIQKVELLELNSPYRSDKIRTERENYYRDWFQVFEGSRVNREYCHVTVTHLVFRIYPERESIIYILRFANNLLRAAKHL